MPRKSRRSSSRKMKRTLKRKTYRRRGGMAPVSYHLSGSWPSRMSLGQGADYFKYHEGQHGGAAPLSAITNSALPAPLRGPAHLDGIDKAIADVKGLRDPPYDTGSTMGGRRRRRRNGSKRSGSKRKGGSKRRQSRKHRRTHRKRGGALGYAPFPSAGMLLSGPKAYAQAGLNPEWRTAVEFTDAKIRESQ